MGEGEKNYPYATHLNVYYGPLQIVDVPTLVAACTDSWHKHDDEDEFFYVVEGRFLIDLEGRTVELGPGQGFVVPKAVMHRPRAPERTVILMVEGEGIVPTGDNPSG